MTQDTSSETSKPSTDTGTKPATEQRPANPARLTTNAGNGPGETKRSSEGGNSSDGSGSA